MPPRILPTGAPAALEALRLPLAARHSVSAAMTASFSTSVPLEKMTRNRIRMYDWFRRKGNFLFGSSSPREPRYLGPHPNQPFPANPLFRSEAVLSEAMRDLIYSMVIEEGKPMKVVSEKLNVDVRRVGAVIRLKQVEKQWVKDGKTLAMPYAKAVMQMLPQTTYDPTAEHNEPHEAINEIPVHKYTTQQLFVPVAESRHFTREDAAKAFHEHLRSPDERSPHWQLVNMEHDLAGQGLVGQAADTVVARKTRAKAKKGFEAAARAEEETIARRFAQQTAEEERAIQSVRTDRFEFRVRDINAEDVGRTGRSSRGIGWRYGAPLQDRKRGLVKIPTSVP